MFSRDVIRVGFMNLVCHGIADVDSSRTVARRSVSSVRRKPSEATMHVTNCDGSRKRMMQSIHGIVGIVHGVTSVSVRAKKSSSNG